MVPNIQMQFLSTENSRRWCRENNISLDAHERPAKPKDAARFEIPADAQKRVYLVSGRMTAFVDEPMLLVWFDDWAVWPSGQRMHVFDRLRMSYGETRPVIDSPGHVFARQEFEHAVSFVTLAVLFLWDCYVMVPARRKFLFFSHDEYGLSHGLNPDSLDDGRLRRVH